MFCFVLPLNFEFSFEMHRSEDAVRLHVPKYSEGPFTEPGNSHWDPPQHAGDEQQRAQPQS